MTIRLLVSIGLAALVASCASTRTARQPEAARVRMAVAQKLADEGEWAGALEAAQAACQAAPDDPEALTLRGIILRERGLLDEAQADLTEALRRRPDSARAHSALALVQERQRRPAEAAVHHRRAVELEPQNARYLNNLGYALLAHGDARGAIPILVRAVREDPTSARNRNNLGFAYGRTGDFGRAAQQFALGGSAAEAQSNLGFAYELDGNLAQAGAHYREALRLDPSLRRAQENLDRLAAHRGSTTPPVAASPPAGAAMPTTASAAPATRSNHGATP